MKKLVLLSLAALFLNAKTIACDHERMETLTQDQDYIKIFRSDLISCNKKLRELQDSVSCDYGKYHISTEELSFSQYQLSFSQYQEILQLLYKYLPRITDYISSIIGSNPEDCCSYLSQEQMEHNAHTVLKRAILNCIFKDSYENKLKRDKLYTFLEECLSKM